MALTPKQEAFAVAVASGKSLSDAYRESYNTENMKPETINNNAYKLTQHNEIATRVAELKAYIVDEMLWDKSRSIKRLASIAENAKPIESVSAIKELNAMYGFNAPTKTEVNLHILPRQIEWVVVQTPQPLELEGK